MLAYKRTERVWVLTARGPAQLAVATLAAQVPAKRWQRLSAGDGAKGPRVYEWARAPLRPVGEPGTGYWLLLRRSLTVPTDGAYYVCCGAAATPLHELVRVAGVRWTIEDAFEGAKGEVDLDQYEVRRWTGWYRHITLALLAHAYLTVVRAQTRADRGAKRGPRTPASGTYEAVSVAALLPLTVPEVRHLLCRVVWNVVPDLTHTLRWATWRRRHQARAQRCHYRRRVARPSGSKMKCGW